MIRVAIIDPHSVARAGLRCFLQNQIDVKIVAEGACAAAAVEAARTKSADVIVMGASNSRPQVTDGLLAAKALDPCLRVMILSDTLDASLARAYLENGADCFMHKACDAASALEAIRAIYQRRRCRSAHCVQADALDTGFGTHKHRLLSAREFDVFLRLARGATVGDIASDLAISLKTVSTFRMRLLRKMKLASNSDLTYYAVKNGLFDETLGAPPRGSNLRMAHGRRTAMSEA